VIGTPMPVLSSFRDQWLGDDLRPALEAYVRKLYGPVQQRLGFREQKGESGETKLLRAEVIHFLAETGNDPAIRRKLAALGRQYLGIGGDGALHQAALPSDLDDAAVSVMVADGDDAIFDAVYERLKKTEDSTERTRYIRALASVRDQRSDKALALSLDPVLRVNEVMLPLRGQLADRRTRSHAYDWFEQHFDALAKRAPEGQMGFSPWFAASFCSASAIPRLAFFTSRIDKLPGGPRSLEGATEALTLCDALVKAQREPVEAFFKKQAGK
jgi:alanyl aminopeptidase